MNVVMTGAGAFVELQGTGEESTFTRDEMNGLCRLRKKALINYLRCKQRHLVSIAELIGTERRGYIHERGNHCNK